MTPRTPISTLFPYTTLFRSGHLFRTRTKELTLEAHGLRLLAKCLRPLPEKWHGLADVEVRYRQRYVDLMVDRKSTRLNSSHTVISYAVFCLKKKKSSKQTRR